MVRQVARPGSGEARRQGCLCKPTDQAAVIDAVMEEILGDASPPHESTGIPTWNSDNCPACNPNLQSAGS